tara:strand:- start:1011 stop:1694 length:684 start_codon:yes stop_codon:yes gene_type:complete
VVDGSGDVTAEMRKKKRHAQDPDMTGVKLEGQERVGDVYMGVNMINPFIDDDVDGKGHYNNPFTPYDSFDTIPLNNSNDSATFTADNNNYNNGNLTGFEDSKRDNDLLQLKAEVDGCDDLVLGVQHRGGVENNFPSGGVTGSSGKHHQSDHREGSGLRSNQRTVASIPMNVGHRKDHKGDAVATNGDDDDDEVELTCLDRDDRGRIVGWLKKQSSMRKKKWRYRHNE